MSDEDTPTIDTKLAEDSSPAALLTSFTSTSFYAGLWFVVAIAGVVSFLFAHNSQGSERVTSVLFLLGSIAAGVGLFLLAVPTYLRMTLSRGLPGISVRSLQVATEQFPDYRYVDLLLAAERFSRRYRNVKVIDCETDQVLDMVLKKPFQKINRAVVGTWPVGYMQEEMFPQDRFWVVFDDVGRPDHPPAIIRARFQNWGGSGGVAFLEVAARRTEELDFITKWIKEDSTEHSIYRNQVVQIGFEQGVPDEWGASSYSGAIQLRFKAPQKVTRDSIVLDDDVHSVIDRNVFDFHRRRKQLARHGIPSRRGLLFHGPPGTGKTYTCHYISHSLDDITTIIVTGQSLQQVKIVCSLARLLQPCLLILEDVDLVFASREINLYSSALGDLMDELDGFQKDDAVIFLLTTNAIERLEQAIKDRPGRINQCVFMDHPNDRLRKQYLQHYMQAYDVDDLDLGEVVRESRGSSQAFLKELVFRAVQISLEGSASESNGHVHLQNEHFRVALKEMTETGSKSSNAIIGFKQ